MIYATGVCADIQSPVICKTNVQGTSFSLGQRNLVRLEGILQLSWGEFLHLLRSTADKGARVKGVKLSQDRGEKSWATGTLQEVIVLSALLDTVGYLVVENTCIHSQEAPAAWQYTIDATQAAQNSDMDVLGTYNATLQAGSWDGTHYGEKVARYRRWW